MNYNSGTILVYSPFDRLTGFLSNDSLNGFRDENDKYWKSVTHYMCASQYPEISDKIASTETAFEARYIADAQLLPLRHDIVADSNDHIILSSTTTPSSSQQPTSLEKAIRLKFRNPILETRLRDTGVASITYPDSPQTAELLMMIRQTTLKKEHNVVISGTPDTRDLESHRLSDDESNLVLEIITYALQVRDDEGMTILFSEMVEDVIYNFYPYREILAYLELNKKETRQRVKFEIIVGLIHDELVASEPSQQHSKECAQVIALFIQWLRTIASKKITQSIYSKLGEKLTIVLPERAHSYRSLITTKPLKKHKTSTSKKEVFRQEALVMVPCGVDSFLVTGNSVSKIARQLLTMGGRKDEVIANAYVFSNSPTVKNKVEELVTHSLSASEMKDMKYKNKVRELISLILSQCISLFKVIDSSKKIIQRNNLKYFFQSIYRCRLSQSDNPVKIDLSDFVDEMIFIDPFLQQFTIEQAASKLLTDQLEVIIHVIETQNSEQFKYVGNFNNTNISIELSILHMLSCLRAKGIELSPHALSSLALMYLPPKLHDSMKQYIVPFEKAKSVSKTLEKYKCQDIFETLKKELNEYHLDDMLLLYLTGIYDYLRNCSNEEEVSRRIRVLTPIDSPRPTQKEETPELESPKREEKDEETQRVEESNVKNDGVSSLEDYEEEEPKTPIEESSTPLNKYNEEEETLEFEETVNIPKQSSTEEERNEDADDEKNEDETDDEENDEENEKDKEDIENEEVNENVKEEDDEDEDKVDENDASDTDLSQDDSELEQSDEEETLESFVRSLKYKKNEEDKLVKKLSRLSHKKRELMLTGLKKLSIDTQRSKLNRLLK